MGEIGNTQRQNSIITAAAVIFVIIIHPLSPSQSLPPYSTLLSPTPTQLSLCNLSLNTSFSSSTTLNLPSLSLTNPFNSTFSLSNSI